MITPYDDPIGTLAQLRQSKMAHQARDFIYPPKTKYTKYYNVDYKTWLRKEKEQRRTRSWLSRLNAKLDDPRRRSRRFCCWLVALNSLSLIFIILSIVVLAAGARRGWGNMEARHRNAWGGKMRGENGKPEVEFTEGAGEVGGRCVDATTTTRSFRKHDWDIGYDIVNATQIMLRLMVEDVGLYELSPNASIHLTAWAKEGSELLVRGDGCPSPGDRDKAASRWSGSVNGEQNVLQDQ